MNEEVSRLKASEEIHKVASSKREEDVKMKETLEQQISQHREQHQKQARNMKYDGKYLGTFALWGANFNMTPAYSAYLFFVSPYIFIIAILYMHRILLVYLDV